MPHLLFGLLFALRWWQDVGWLLVALVLAVSIVLYLRWRTHPTWLFPWLGYSLVPLVAYVASIQDDEPFMEIFIFLHYIIALAVVFIGIIVLGIYVIFGRKWLAGEK